jgi:hypothetical protein
LDAAKTGFAYSVNISVLPRFQYQGGRDFGSAVRLSLIRAALVPPSPCKRTLWAECLSL